MSLRDHFFIRISTPHDFGLFELTDLTDHLVQHFARAIDRMKNISQYSPFLSLKETDLGTGGRFLVIGDIHGEFEMLNKLLNLAGMRDNDIVIALGDLIDRGDASEEVVHKFQKEKNFFSLLGNHEAMMLAVMEDDLPTATWFREGGRWAAHVGRRLLQEMRDFAISLPIAAELQLDNGQHIGLVHADLPIDTSWEQVRKISVSPADWVDRTQASLATRLLWDRSVISSGLATERQLPESKFNVESLSLLISGHTVVPKHSPLRIGNRLWIDTGAFCGGSWTPFRPGGRLTAVDPIAKVYWQVGRNEDEKWGPIVLP